MKYDIENMLTDIRKTLVAQLNTAIAAVEAEKIAQGLPATGLKPVDVTIGADGRPRGYFEQDWSDAILNVSPAIWYGFETTPAEGVGPATKQTLEIFIDIVHADQGTDALRNRRTNRYTRAIRDVIEANYDRFPGGNQIKIKTIKPMSFKIDQDSSEEIRVGGIALTTALA